MVKKKASAPSKAETDNVSSQHPYTKDNHQEGNRNLMPRPKGILIAIGGKENKGETAEIDSNQKNNENFEQYSILQRFVDELKGDNSLFVVIPTASCEPVE